MGDDPVPNAIEQAMDDQFVDNTLSEYIINWGFHNNAGKNGNTSKKPIILSTALSTCRSLSLLHFWFPL